MDGRYTPNVEMRLPVSRPLGVGRVGQGSNQRVAQRYVAEHTIWKSLRVRQKHATISRLYAIDGPFFNVGGTEWHSLCRF